jgi:hypothetical protein
VIDPNEKGVITRTQAVCRGSPKSFNISEQAFLKLSAKTLESLSKLDKYHIPSGVVERLRQKKPFNDMTELQLKEILDEFKKYIAILIINYRNGKKVEMVGELIDEIWHTFILFTNEYRKFCETIIGEYIHHEPNVSSYGVDPLFSFKKKQGTEFFYEEYERCFGALPDVWKHKQTFETKKSRNLKKPIRFAVLSMVICLVVYTLICAYTIHFVGFGVLATVYGFIAFVGMATMYAHCKSRDSQYFLGISFASIFITLLIMGAVVVLICQEAYELRRAIALISAALLSSTILFYLVRNWQRIPNNKPTLPIGYRSSGARHLGFYGGGCGSIASSGGDGGGGGCGGGGCGGGGGC